MILGLHETHSGHETQQLGKSLANTLTENAILALSGDLGAGKTTFIQGLAQGIGSIDPRIVSSPTFTLLNIYEGDKTIYHFDLYRLPKEEDFFAAGFDEYFFAGGICCLEWAEKISSKLPINTYFVNIAYSGEESRQIEITKREK